MPEFYLPQNAAANPIKPAAQSASQVSADAAGTIETNQQLGAAKAFQDHLNRGYQGMLETLKEVPPQIAATLPDPGAFSDSEDKRVAWYAMLNDAVAKNGLLDAAQKHGASPDALATEAARAPLSPESQKQVGGEINRLDQRQQVSAIQKAIGTPQPVPAAPAAEPTPSIDPKTPFGRNLKIALTRMEPHADTIQTAAEAAKIPPQLVMAVAAQESAGTTSATSKTGVKGTMQVTEGTFKDIASRYPDLKLTDRTDPEQSYTAGALYLGELMQKFGNNVEQALAAYNAGPTAVRQAVAKYPSDWKDHLAEFVSAPKGMTTEEKAQETFDYVNKVGKYFSALGGKAPAAAAKAPTQNEFNMALLNENPNAIVNPIAKEIKSGLRADAYIDAKNQQVAMAGQVQNRLMQKFKAEQDFKTYQKINNYNKQIEKISPAAQAVIRIDQMVGGLDNNKPIAGFGFGEKAFKRFMQTSASPEARDMRIAMANLFADVGLATSGQNFTKAEMDRLESRLGNTFFSDESAFRSAIKQQRERLYQALNNPWEALPDDVKKELYDDGVMNPEFFGQFKSDLVNTDNNPEATGPKGKEAAANTIATKSGKKFKIVKRD